MSRMSYMMRDECDSGRMASVAASYGEEHASSEREDVTISQLQWAAHYLLSTKPMNMDKQIKSDMNAMKGKAIIISPRRTDLPSRESRLECSLSFPKGVSQRISTFQRLQQKAQSREANTALAA